MTSDTNGSIEAGVRPDDAVGPASTTAELTTGTDRERLRPFLLLLLAALIVLWLARAVIGPFIVAGVLAYAFSPLVSAGERRLRWPRIAVVGIGYLITVAILAVVGYLVAGQAVAEFQAFSTAGPDALATTLRQLIGTDAIEIGSQRIPVADVARALQSGVAGIFASPTDALRIATALGEAALQSILVLIVAFYFLVDGSRFIDQTVALLPIEHQDRTMQLLGRIHEVLGKWLRGQLLLVALVAAVVYVILGPVLHIPYALAIGVLTGVLEVIPLVGPLAATAIAGVDAFAHGGAGLAGLVVAIFFVLRQVEDQVVMPVVIGRAVHLHPIVTIFAVLVGLSTYGVLGGLLGVPVAAALNVVFRELYASRAATPSSADPLDGDEPAPVSASG
jgi:predicted PurR-regulated permease PerM